MKKIVLCFVLLFSSVFAYADQLTSVNLRQAKLACEFLLRQDKIIVFCGCCDKDEPQCLTVIDVRYVGRKGAKPEDDDYQIFVKGRDTDGQISDTPIDLAYTYYKSGDNACCVAKYLGLKCDPCINLFSWDERFFFSESNVGNDTSVVSCKAYVVDGTSIKPVSDKDESNMTLCPKTSIPNVMSSVYIENNRDKPFIVYINGVRKGVIRAYKEITIDFIAVSPTIITVVQESGYMLYPSKYEFTLRKCLWGEKYNWSFSKNSKDLNKPL